MPTPPELLKRRIFSGVDTQAPQAPLVDLSEQFSPPFSSTNSSPPKAVPSLSIPPTRQHIEKHFARRSKSQDFRLGAETKAIPRATTPGRRHPSDTDLSGHSGVTEQNGRSSPPPGLSKYRRRESPPFGAHAPPAALQDLTLRTRSLKEKRSAIYDRSPQERPHDSPVEEEPQSLIMIGIDFGTTFSGVAWATSDQPDDIKPITNWQSHDYENSDKGKAPTEISYASADGEITWGYGIPGTESVKWFKLLLLDEEDMEDGQKKSPQITRARELLRTAKKTPVQAIADYLRFLFEHALDVIKQDLGESVVEAYAFRIVLTIPAVWTNQCKQRMKRAAAASGMLAPRTIAGKTSLHFVSEPEAAALATFDDMKSRPNFQPGDSLVVCDAGGGTVDLISYKVYQASPMQLRECVQGSGRLCGAVFLDQDFEALMEQFLDDLWDVSDDGIKRIMKHDWENGIKRNFTGSDRDWQVILPYCCTSRGAPPHITLKKGHVSDIFENVISQIRALVNEQIRLVNEKEGKLPKAIVLVGGFGSCMYLFNQLQMENKDRGIAVHKSSGAKPWTAICRGAVLKALTNSNLPGVTVESRVSRCSYGIRHRTQFIEGKHLDEDKCLDPIDGKHWARNQMTWYLKKGNDIEEKDPVLLSWHSHHPALELSPTVPFTVATAIYSCDEDAPPSRLQHNVKHIATIQVSLEASKLKDVTGKNGVAYKRASYAIEMTVIGTALEFSLIFEGKRMGAQNVEVHFED